MDFIPTSDADVVTPHPALAVEQGGRGDPFFLGFYLFEQRNTGRLRIFVVPRLNPTT
jgi:hypothetical protein